MIKRFQSSPAPKSRCNAAVDCWLPIAVSVSILTGSEEPVQLISAGNGDKPSKVSILTGSEEPVQRPHDRGFQQWRGVSILTGSEEPVQLLCRGQKGKCAMFQSSPAPKSRCNSTPLFSGLRTTVSILTGSEEPVQL